MEYPVEKAKPGYVIDLNGYHWVCLKNNPKCTFMLMKKPKRNENNKVGHEVGYLSHSGYFMTRKWPVIYKYENMKTISTLFGDK